VSSAENQARENLCDWLGRLDVAARAAEGALNLVPSENRMSPLAQRALSTDFYNRYFFNDALRSDFWEFRGGEDIAAFERDLVIPSLRTMASPGLDSDVYVNIRPISGLSAMLMAVSALAGAPGGPVAHLARSDGGHFATESLIGRMGYAPRAVRFNRGRPVESSFHAALNDGKVRLLYLDFQNFICEVDVAGAVALARSIQPDLRIHVDASHTLGLIFGGVLANPLAAGADSFGGSTHKTFPGPQKGVLFTQDADVAEAFLHAQFDFVSSHHFAETLALGFAALEFQYFRHAYARQVVANAKALAAELIGRGFAVHDAELIAAHQVWMPLSPADSVWEYTQVLKSSGIRLNVQTDLPGVPGPCVRLGTNEITFLGAGADSMPLLADAFADARDLGACKPGASETIWQSFGDPYFIRETAF
jgi:glycine hydroxymethyltransferase